jgi:hypothetical protein
MAAGQTSSTMSRLHPGMAKILEDLSDDCLTLIVEQLDTRDRRPVPLLTWTPTRPQHIKNFSLVNKRLRRVCGRKLFRFVHVSMVWEFLGRPWCPSRLPEALLDLPFVTYSVL